MKKKIQKQVRKIMKDVWAKTPEITIERIGWDSKTGALTFLDVHNEADGHAYFFCKPSRHFHGFNKPKKV